MLNLCQKDYKALCKLNIGYNGRSTHSISPPCQCVQVQPDSKTVTWFPCTAHQADLFIEDLSKFSWIAPTISIARKVNRLELEHECLLRRKKSRIAAAAAGMSNEENDAFVDWDGFEPVTSVVVVDRVPMLLVGPHWILLVMGIVLAAVFDCVTQAQ